MILADHPVRLFVGNGVKHAGTYAVIVDIPQKRELLSVGTERKFTMVPDFNNIKIAHQNGVRVVPASELSAAAMPMHEVIRLREKHGIVDLEIESEDEA